MNATTKLTATEIDAMGKAELRAACKANGVPYGKLTNSGMRDALKALHVESASTEPADEQEVIPATNSTMGAIVSQLMINNGQAPAPEKTQRKPAPAKAATGKIEKNREERNGVKRPSAGGMCRAVWDALDALVAAGTQPAASDVKVLAEKNEWNKNNASIEFYQWRKFNGISGRTAAKK